MNRGFILRALALGSALALALSGAAMADSKPRPQPRRGVEAPVKPLGSFTPSLIDSPGAAALRPGAGVDARQYRFTPSGKPGDRRAVTLGVRARALAAPDAPRGSDEAPGYDVGVALGLKGVAVTGQMARVEGGLTRREAVSVGLAYGRRDWSTMLRLGAEDSGARGLAPTLIDRRYSVELGTSYSLKRNFSVGAGVRYRLASEPVSGRLDTENEDGAAFVGVGLAF